MGTYTVSAFLGPSLTAGYKPGGGGFGILGYSRSATQGQFPFLLSDVPDMLPDPMVSFGQRVLCAPLAGVKWEVISSDKAAIPYISTQFRRFWKRDLRKACTMLKWGVAAGELLYQEKNGRVTYKGMREIHPGDAKPGTVGNDLACIEVANLGSDHKQQWLWGPRGFWVANEAEFGNLYGKSRLEGCHEPWKEKCAKRGYNDIRRTFFSKNSYRGAQLRYPNGSSLWIDGTYRNNRDIAQQLLEWYEAGHTVALPGETDANGNYVWAWEDATPFGSATNILEYGDKLNDLILIGQGIPPEMVRAAETGGWSGRAIPAQTFYAAEDEIVNTIAEAFCTIALRPLVQLEFPGCDFEIEFTSLVDMLEEQSQRPGAGKGYSLPPGQEGQPPKPGRGNQGVKPPVKQISWNNKTVQGGGQTIAMSLANENDVAKLVKQVSGTHEMTQQRAKAGGEIGPNGEWYPGGAWIATKDIPKRVRDKIEKAAKGKVQVDGYEWAVPEPGKMSILDRLGGTVLNPRNGEVNYGFLEYQKSTPEEVKMYEEIADKWANGERWINVADYPALARLKDLARLVVAGEPIPGDAMAHMPTEWQEHLSKYKPKASLSLMDMADVAPIQFPPSADKAVRRLIEQTQLLSRDAKDAIRAALKDLPPAEQPAAIRRILAENKQRLQKQLAEAYLACWLLGIQDAATIAEAFLVALPVLDIAEGQFYYPFVVAVAHDLLSRQLLTREELDAAAIRMQQQAEEVATFEIDAAATRQEDALAAVEEGEEFTPEDVIPPARVETILATKMYDLYGQGMEYLLDSPRVGQTFPYASYHCTHDDQLRATHRQVERSGLNGTNIFRRDDPVWEKYRPPWDWNDRCTWTPLTVQQAAMMGAKEAKLWMQSGKPPAQPQHVADPGFTSTYVRES